MAYTQKNYDDNAEDADTRFPKKLYAPVTVVITETKGKSLKFYVYGDNAKSPRQAEWGNEMDMWAPCPSTITDSKDFGSLAAAPQAGTIGLLYLSDTFVANKINSVPKWPLKLKVADDEPVKVKMFPIKVTFTGVEMRSGRFIKTTIELTDPNQAAALQNIRLDGSSVVELKLNKSALADLNLSGVDDDSDG